jgi:hypothetical protein
VTAHQIFDFPVIAANEVAIISTRDVLEAKVTAGSRLGDRSNVSCDKLLDDALQSLQLARAQQETVSDAADALLDSALEALDGSSDLD